MESLLHSDRIWVRSDRLLPLNPEEICFHGLFRCGLWSLGILNLERDVLHRLSNC